MRAVPFLLILITGLFTSEMMLKAILPWSGSASAQVTSDGTTNTIINSNGNNFTILNGSAKDNNLFHSFNNFSVPTGGSARFDLINTPNITTIFSRVTGGNVSNIDGLISTLNSNNAVSLFLMNPAGIVFGANARLNIGGSFVGTTANSINFADGTEFSAVNTSGTPLLTISVPVGLQLGANAGAIQVQGADLRVKTGQTLALVGSQIDMTGAKLTAPNGHIELWAVQNAGIKMENQAQWQLTSPVATTNWGTITLQKASLVDASGINGGAINIRGRGLTVQDGSNISSTTFAGQGKGITVNTTDFVDLLGVSLPGQFNPGIGTSLGVFFGPPATGQAGDVTVETGRLKLANGAWLQSSSNGNNSRSGDVTVRASDVEVVGSHPFFAIPTSITTTLFGGKNNQSGNISIETNRMRVQDGGIVSTSLIPFNGISPPTGKAGNISIRATESLDISGYTPSLLLSGVGTRIGQTEGDAGNISIDVGRLHLFNGGSIRSTLSGKGKAGNITIHAQEVAVSDPVIDVISKLPGGITVSVGDNSVGSGGNIALTADNLRLFNGGQITSSSQGQANAGNINLQVKNLDIQGMSQPLTNGQIVPSTIAASSTTNFNAGTIDITSDTVKVRNGAEVTVSNIGGGDAGNLNITANNIFLDNKASLRSEVKGGSQGNIDLQANDVLLLRRGSNITTNATGTSTGGNIDITAGAIIALPDEDSDIVANAVLGSGGNIQITTQGIFGLKFRPQLTPESDITASSQFGVSGTVQVNTIGIDPNSGLVELPVNVTDPSQQIATGCAGSEGSRFVATGRGGVPQNPNQVTSDVYDGLRLRTWSDIRNLTAYRKTGEVIAQIPTKEAVIVQATGWRRNTQGKIELIATQSDAHVQQPLTCAAVPKS
ncbi:S-layer family protein [Nostoc sp. DedQUE09]|uniref:S-layer family protein n=1 Tax=Nostoc sp. DedQUE09 TaxID=3075394 RepID=UPI002AD30EDB|nr:S-layer family protein [Nostoc sp. DedQUE09]MDZ7951228.1 S-layer family protein [Nostoc sp. DedQUE09]